MSDVTMSRLQGSVAVFIAAFLWGTTGTAATFAPEVSAVAIGAVAMGGGGILQALFALKGIVKWRGVLRQYWRCLVLGAFAVAIYPLAFYASMRFAGVTVGTAISIGSAPLLSALLECRMDGLRLTIHWMLGATIGLIGMLLLCLAEGTAVSGSRSSLEVIQGVLLSLLAGLTYAVYSWTARRLMLKAIPSRVVMGATFGLGGILLVPVLFMTGEFLLASLNNFAVGIYMAIVPMFFGYICFGYGLAHIPVSLATTITLFEPVVAAGLAIVVVGERLSVLGLVGIFLIIVCLIFITVPVKALKKQLI